MGFVMFALRLPIIVVFLVAGCGEFHTRQYYEVSTEDTGSGEVRCGSPVELEVVPVDPVEAVLYEPFALTLSVDLASLPREEVGLDWEITSGRLPSGLYLDWQDGTITGFPLEAGEFEADIGISANPAFHPCIEGGGTHLSVHVLPGCVTDEDCPLPKSVKAGEALCLPPGSCHLREPPETCPGAFGTRVTWSAEGMGTAKTEWTVEENEELTIQEKAAPKQKPYTHRLRLADGPDKGAGGTGAATLLYRLATGWPLPFSPGDVIRASHGEAAGAAGASALLLAAGDGSRPVLLYDGPLLPAVIAGVCTHAACPSAVEQFHLDCPAQDVFCGPGTPDVVVVTTGTGTQSMAANGESSVFESTGHDMMLAVGSAYSHSYQAFNFEDCLGVAPTWSSFMLFDRDSCPIASFNRTSPGTRHELGHAFEAPAEEWLNGMASFSHDGTSVVEWTWSLEQPVPGLVVLDSKLPGLPPDEKGPHQLLRMPVVGTYTLRLQVKDEVGQVSCSADVDQIEVGASPDTQLRIEAVWRVAGAFEHDEELTILLKHPLYGESLESMSGDQLTNWFEQKGIPWVCSKYNAIPQEWMLGFEENKPEVCTLSAGDLSQGLPQVATMNRLSTTHKDNRYQVGLLAPPGNTSAIEATFRVFIDGQPRYQGEKILTPGQLWVAGAVAVHQKKFEPSQP